MATHRHTWLTFMVQWNHIAACEYANIQASFHGNHNIIVEFFKAQWATLFQITQTYIHAFTSLRVLLHQRIIAITKSTKVVHNWWNVMGLYLLLHNCHGNQTGQTATNTILTRFWAIKGCRRSGKHQIFCTCRDIRAPSHSDSWINHDIVHKSNKSQWIIIEVNEIAVWFLMTCSKPEHTYGCVYTELSSQEWAHKRH